MNRILFSCVEVAAAAVFLIPFFLHLNKVKFQSGKTTAAALVFALYLCAVYAMVGLPNVTYIRFDPRFNFTPFQYMFSDFTTLLNILLFMPLGFFLPVLRSKFRSFGVTVLFGFCMSMFIEILQIFTLRATDVNDLMTNTLGTVLGYWIGRLILMVFPRLRLAEETKEMRTICIAVLAVMFFLQPFPASLFRKLLY